MGASCEPCLDSGCCEATSKPINEHTIEDIAPSPRKIKSVPSVVKQHSHSRSHSMSYSNSNNMSSINSKEEELIEGNLTEDFINTIHEGNVTMFKQYVQQYPLLDLINKRLKDARYDGDRCLDIAIKCKQYDIMRCILDYGTTTLSKQHKITGNTSLHVAVNEGDLLAVKLLCRYGIDKDIVNKNGDKAIDIAIDADGSLDNVYNPICDELQEARYDGMTSQEIIISQVNSVLHKPSKEDNDCLSDDGNGFHSVNVTAELDIVTSNILEDISDTMRSSERKLEAQYGWLDKKTNTPPYGFNKRWVVLRDGWLCWSDRQITVYNDKLTENERKRFNKKVRLVSILSIEALGKTERKFKFRTEKREYIWRAKDKEKRDDWMKHLNDHVDFSHQASLFEMSGLP